MYSGTPAAAAPGVSVGGMIASVSRESVAYSAGVKNAGAYGAGAGVCASVTWTCWP